MRESHPARKHEPPIRVIQTEDGRHDVLNIPGASSTVSLADAGVQRLRGLRARPAGLEPLEGGVECGCRKVRESGTAAANRHGHGGFSVQVADLSIDRENKPPWSWRFLPGDAAGALPFPGSGAVQDAVEAAVDFL